MYLYLPRSDGTPCRQLPTLNAVSLTTLPPYPYTLPSTSDIFGQTCTSTMALRILYALEVYRVEWLYGLDGASK